MKPTTIYYFGTCLVDLLYPKAGLAGMQLLKRAGIEVIFPEDQSCCGQPAFNSGYRREALKVARAQLACFAKDIPIVVPSASCAGMMKHHWPELFEGEADADTANAIAQRVYELTEFLTDVLQLELNDLGEPVKVAVHNSCASQREMGVAEHSQKLLNQLANVEIVQHERPRECCGFGGTFAVKQADISGAMVTAKTTSLKNTHADKIISQDCGCLMNIGGALAKQQANLPTQHIAEFLWERTNAETNSTSHLSDFYGKLKGSKAFSGDPVKIQRSLRDEWN